MDKVELDSAYFKYRLAMLFEEKEFDLLFGPAYKGIPIVTSLASSLSKNHNIDKPFTFNRKEAKDHGEKGQLVGAPIKGRVLIVDDVITAGMTYHLYLKGTAIREAFEIISKQYGGIDILISNAGTAIGGSIAEVDDKILRRSFEDNFFSHQNCASETIKIMKKQNIEGCLLFNISKQSVNPGKNFGPYGLPKSALLNLCKQYAVDYGSIGIRSNGVNADRIRSGLMTDKMIKTRAKARSVTTDDYMKGNLLLNEVKAEDVAKAFFHLATSKKTTGAVLTVDGGNIAASLR